MLLMFYQSLMGAMNLQVDLCWYSSFTIIFIGVFHLINLVNFKAISFIFVFPCLKIFERDLICICVL